MVEMPASRGPVKDRNGQPLAISTPVESIWASPEDFEADEAKLRSLARALGLDAAEIRQKVANKDRQFVWLKRQISPEQAAQGDGAAASRGSSSSASSAATTRRAR